MGEILPFETGNLPAHIASKFGLSDVNTDLTANVGTGGFPTLSYKGKVWHVVRGGERTLVTNPDGDPRSSIEVVILKGNPHISKIYYAGGYEEGSDARPTCYSNNGESPALDSVERQSEKCATCRHNVWGSRITESGAKGKSCTDSRRLAVAPVGDLENPMLLRIPAATLKELTEYANMLNRRRAAYNAVVTKISFDHTVAYQKLQFKPLRFLTEEEADVVVDVMNRDIIGNILGLTDVPLRQSHSEIPDIPGEPPARLMQSEEAPAPKPRSTSKFGVSADEVEAVFEPVPAAQSPAAAPRAPNPEPVAVKQEKPAAQPEKPVVVIDEMNASLDEILSQLDD